MNTAEIDRLFNIEDKAGHLYSVNAKLYLKLHSEKRVRNIGRILVGYDPKGLPFLCYAKMEKEKDLHRKTNSWSVYHEIAKRVRTISYQSEKQTYYTGSKLLFKYGKYLDFGASSGIEKKIYLELDYWEFWDNKTNKLIKEAKAYH